MNQLTNRQPGVRYVLCPMGEQASLYELRGYKVVRYSKTGVRPRVIPGDLKEGEIIEMQGSVLMQISQADYDQIYWYGVDGAGGQDELDHHESMVMDRDTYARDELRGVQGFQSKIGVTNESTPAGPEGVSRG